MKVNTVALAAATVSIFSAVDAADVEPGHVLVLKRTTNTILADGLVRRQAGPEFEFVTTTIEALEDASEECQSAFSVRQENFNTDVPLPDTSLALAVDEYAAANDIDEAAFNAECGIIEVTGSLSSDWASYTSDYQSWLDEYSAGMSSVISACSEDEAVTEALLEPFETVCTALGDEFGGAGPAGPRETGIMMAAVVGVAGMVAAAM